MYNMSKSSENISSLNQRSTSGDMNLNKDNVQNIKTSILASSSQFQDCFIGNESVTVNVYTSYSPSEANATKSTKKTTLLRNILKPKALFKDDKSILYNNFQEVLQLRAQEIAGEMKFPFEIDRKIDKVPLKIAGDIFDKVEEFDQQSETNHRKDSNRSKCMWQCNNDEIEIETIFRYAKSYAKFKAKKHCNNNAASAKYIERHGNIVGVSGEAGIGKSTLCKIFINKILDNSISDFKYIFYIPLSSVEYDTETNLLQFLVANSSCDWTQFADNYLSILDKINKSSKVIIIFDGLDEAVLKKPTESCNIVPLDAVTTAETFIKNILQGQLLSKAKKFITSRPDQLLDLHHECKPQFMVKVDGFSASAQEQMCKNICDDTWKDSMKYITDHPNISAYCYVPIYCILTMFYLKKCFSNNLQAAIQSITSVLLYVLVVFVKSDHFRNDSNFNLKSLAQLAWNGIIEQKHFFSEEDLKNCEVQTTKGNSFLDTGVKPDRTMQINILYKSKKSSFAHLTMQEFFAAVYFVWFMPIEECLKSINNFEDSHFEMVTKFIFGLLNEVSISTFHDYLKPEFQIEKSVIASKLELMKNFAKVLLLNKENYSMKTSSFLRACEWIYEIQDEDLANLLDDIDGELKINLSEIKSHVFGFLYFLQNRKKNLSLSLYWKSEIYKAQWFFEEMSKILSSKPNIKILTISVRSHPYFLSKTAPSVYECLTNITKICLVNCNVSLIDAQKLSNSLKQLRFQINVLDLSENDLGDQGATAISLCLNNVKELYLYKCCITAVGIIDISKAVKYLNNPLKVLQLACNSLGDEGAIALSTCVNKIENLYLNSCDISVKGVELLSKEIMKTTNGVNKLMLGHNKLGDDGVRFISLCLHRIKILHLENNDITPEGILHLSNAIKELSTPMEELFLDKNKFGDDGAEILSTCIQKIKEKISLNLCDITAKGSAALTGTKNTLTYSKQLQLQGIPDTDVDDNLQPNCNLL